MKHSKRRLEQVASSNEDDGSSAIGIANNRLAQ